MIITGKTFATKKEEIDYLVKHKKEIIEFKKAVVKHTTPTTTEAENSSTFKALSTSKEHDTDNVIKRTVIGNTYNWLDSHGDVHLDGTFGKSISERQNKIWHLHDHEQKITAKVGIPSKIYEEKIEWSDLGIKKAGTTTALMMDSNIRKDYNNLIFQEYKDGNIDQHSVGMYYVKIDFAVNDKDHKAEFKTWNDNIESIGNRESAEELGYFYAVKEAKLVEISAVLQGSNELTPTIEAKDIEPEQSTQTNEPEKSTRKNNNLRNNLLI
jgi:hypothetical protein